MPKSWIFVAKKFPSYTPQGVVLNLSPQLIRCWTIAQKSCSRGKECSKSQWEPLQTKAKTGAFSRFKYLLDFQAYLEGWTPQKLWVQKLNRNQNRAPQQCLVLLWWFSSWFQWFGDGSADSLAEGWQEEADPDWWGGLKGLSVGIETTHQIIYIIWGGVKTIYHLNCPSITMKYHYVFRAPLGCLLILGWHYGSKIVPGKHTHRDQSFDCVCFLTFLNLSTGSVLDLFMTWGPVMGKYFILHWL